MGIYSFFEDKWYAVIEAIDRAIPITKLTDRIDGIIPSFILFLIVLIAVIAFLALNFGLLGFNLFTPMYTAEITVLSSNNLPLQGAAVLIMSACGEELILQTDSSGIATGVVCSTDLDVSVRKTGYNNLGQSLSLEDGRATLRLSPIQIQTNSVYVEVRRTDETKIIGANIELICSTSQTPFRNQTSSGFTITVPIGCTSAQIKASASGFSEKRITITNESRKIIHLEEVNTKGNAQFVAENIDGMLSGVEVNITSSFGQVRQYFTNVFGKTPLIELEEGSYTYIATSTLGEDTSGNFSVDSGRRKEVNLFFELVSNDANDPTDPVNTTQVLALEIVDGLDVAIPSAQVRMFKNNEFYGEKRTMINGRTTAKTINTTTLAENTFFSAVIRATGYETKVVDLVLVASGNYQKVVLNEGGATLKLSVVNDILVPENGAFVSISLTGVPETISDGYTDINGKLIIDNLPAGNYEIYAIDAQEKDEANEQILVSANSIKNEIITLVTGEGRINFSLLGTNERSTTADFDIYKTDVNGSAKLASMTNKNSYRSNSLKIGTKLLLSTTDGNYFTHETINYEVTRGTKSKEAFLRNLGDLPNNNEVQMFLMKIYPSNPIYTSTSRSTTKLMSDSSYWVYFDLIINNELNDFAIGNFVSENATIENIFSIDDARIVLSDNLNNSIIDISEDSIVESNAVQGNVVLDSVTGTRSIPIIVEIKTDVNSENVKLNFEAIHGTYRSLAYSKDFVIGETFCTISCPVFAFDNFSIVNGITTPLDETSARIYLDDTNTYIKTIVQNLSDRDIGTSTLQNSVPTAKQRYLLLSEIQTDILQSINLYPFSASEEKTINLSPKSVGSGQIIQSVSQEVGGINQLDSYTGNHSLLGIDVVRRTELEIGTSPNQVDVGRIYPLFIVKTNHKGRYVGKSMHWYVELVRNTVVINEITRGTTDENGLSFITLDTTNYSAGDVLKFTSYDEDGSVPGIVEINVVEPFVPEIEVHECLSVEFEGVPTDIKTWTSKNVGEISSIKIKSECENASRVHVHTDLDVSQNFADIPSNGEVNIVVTANPRNDLLGVYPIQVVSINGANYHQLAALDILVNDLDNCFQLSAGIFDFRNDGEIEALIENTCFDGRQDNFYPQMNLQTNSVSIAFDKPGNPEVYGFRAKVVGKAIESMVYGYVKSDVIRVSETGGHDSDPRDHPTSATKAFDSQTVADYCEDLMYQGEFTPKPEPIIEETTLPPTSIYTPSGLISTTGSSSTITGREEDSGELQGIKENKISFSPSVAEINRQALSEINAGGTSGITGLKKDSIGTLGTGTPPSYYNNESSTTNLAGNGTPTINSGPYHPGGYYMEYYWDAAMSDIYGTIAIGAPRPPSCSTDGEWHNVREKNLGRYKVIDIKARNHAKVITANYTGGGGVLMRYYVKGVTVHNSMFDISHKTAYVQTQLDFTRAIEWFSERQGIWEEDVNIIRPVEGRHYKIGSYSSATPLPCWTSEDSAYGYESGEEFSPGGKTFITVGCVQPNNLVDPERVAGKEWEIKDANDPLIEYDGSGKIMYEIPSESIPPELRVFLKNREYYAEYVGLPEIDSPDINFTLTQNNLQGQEYTILEASDWVGATTETQAFQLKLVGNESLCFASDGTEGMTGTAFAPRLLFDWSWGNIRADQCDTTNGNYTYCDAAQFTTSLFKKLDTINNLLEAGRKIEVPSKTAFYAHLIADNYSAEFLEDYKDYYIANLFVSSPIFNEKYAAFITSGKLHFEMPQGMSEGGIYRVEIDIGNIESTNSLFNSGQPTTDVTITLTPRYQANNYNPFYETPFDGEIGGDLRSNYGTTVNGELKLNDNVNANNDGSALKTITLQDTSNLNDLQDGIILEFDRSSGVMQFTPQQPTPVAMSVTGTGNVSAEFNIQGSHANTLTNKEWLLTSSTIGQAKCHDFENNNRTIFYSPRENDQFAINWNGTKPGELTLSTVFFTPKLPEEILKINPANDKTTLDSYAPLKTSLSVFLSNYDDTGRTNYDTLKGLIDMIKEEKLCVSKNSSETMKIFWNQEYLNRLIQEVSPNTGFACQN